MRRQTYTWAYGQATALWRTVFRRFAPAPIRYGTDECTSAITAAWRLAESNDHPFVGTEHLLFGVMSAAEGTAARILDGLGINVQHVGTDVALGLARLDFGPPVARRLHWSPRAREALAAGLREAHAAGLPRVGSEYLLLGLLGDSAGVSAEFLRRHGVTAVQFRDAVLRDRS
jgi:ATP-dependent Clp protease ATP-binding subunit ClpC